MTGLENDPVKPESPHRWNTPFNYGQLWRVEYTISNCNNNKNQMMDITTIQGQPGENHAKGKSILTCLANFKRIVRR